MAADSTLPPPLPRSPGGSLLDDDGNWRLKKTSASSWCRGGSKDRSLV